MGFISWVTGADKHRKQLQAQYDAAVNAENERAIMEQSFENTKVERQANGDAFELYQYWLGGNIFCDYTRRLLMVYHEGTCWYAAHGSYHKKVHEILAKLKAETPECMQPVAPFNLPNRRQSEIKI